MMTEEQILYWVLNSKGIEKEIVADYLYENSRYNESKVIRAIGQIEQGKPVKTRIIAWGNNQHGQCDNQKIDDAIQVSCGSNHSVALRRNGALVSWGQERFDQLNIPSGFNDIKKIEAASDYTIALKNDGSVRLFGQPPLSLWAMYASDLKLPPDDLNDVVDISAGEHQFTVLKSNNTLDVFGDNYNGGCHLMKPMENIVKIFSRKNSNFGLNNEGKLLRIGPDYYDMNDLLINKDIQNIHYIATTKSNAIILKNNGRIKIFGNKALTKGTRSGKINGIIQVESSTDCFLALKIDGTILAFGKNPNIPKINNVIQIAAHDNHCVALMLDEK